LGSKYASLSSLFVLGVLLYGLAAPGGIGGTLLTSVGKQHRSVLVSLVQLSLFLILFYELWPVYQLAGAVLASGLSMASSNFLLMVAAKYRNAVKFSFARDYSAFALALISAAILNLRLTKLGPNYPLIAWPFVVLLFCVVAGYRVAECKRLVGCFLPVSGLRGDRLS